MFVRFSYTSHDMGYPMGNMILLYLCIYVVQKIHPFIQFCATTATVCGKGKEGERISFSLRSVLLVPPNLLQSPPSSLLVIPKLFPWQEKPTSLGKPPKGFPEKKTSWQPSELRILFPDY